MSVASNRLGGLHQVLNLREVGIRVPLVHECVEVLAGLPDTHLAFAQDGVLPLLLLCKFARLPRVILPVEFAYAGRSRFVAFSEVLGLTIRVVACSNEIVPMIQIPLSGHLSSIEKSRES